ncbi:hypothetical protein [Mycobacterium kyogaense]|uniref:hypothetical protein n=1 Tax=Mycobacterium kyogaense TaxID=2212479 RepID=UPI000DAE5836|nr:hypothetical protein [Mycobacterium kyogaense]
MSKKYKLVFWGPGHVGGNAMREALRRPEFEVVGAKVWSPSKDGVDVGVLAGGDPVGVLATSDAEAIYALDADCVIHTPQPMADAQNEADVLELLKSGKNIISTAAYHFPHRRGAEYVKRLEEACAIGNVTVKGSGPHPSFWGERIILSLTALMSKVKHVRLVEACNADVLFAEMGEALVHVMGMGQSLDWFNTDCPGYQMMSPYYRDVGAYIGVKLFGVSPDEIRFESTYDGIPAEHDLMLGTVPVKKGTAVGVRLTENGFIGDHHFYTHEEIGYIGAHNRNQGLSDVPFGPFAGDVNYIVDIDGDPSRLRAQFDMSTTRDDGVPVITHMSGTLLLQLVAPVCKAPNGIMYERPMTYAAPDFRTLPAVTTQESDGYGF